MFFVYTLILKAIFTSLIFLFLFWAIRTNYKTAVSLPEQPQSAAVFLLEVQAPDATFTYPLIKNSTLGRAETADISVNDQAVSAKHCSFRQRGSSWYVADLNSLNGTYVNEQKVSRPVKIKENDRIRVGKTIILVLKNN